MILPRSYLAILLLFLAAAVICGKDYYEVLGVSKTATTKEIKRAFRKMAKEFHPDKNPSEANKNLFKEASTAHEVLTDEEKRKIYDRYGEEGLKDHMTQERSGSRSHGGSSFFDDGVFSFFFGGGGQRRSQGPMKQTGATIKLELAVTLEELYNGEFVEFLRVQPTKKEAPGKRRCNCRMETITKSLGPGSYQMMQQEVCDECPKIKFVTEEHFHEAEIEIGMDKEETLPTFNQMGEPHLEGEYGDLVFVIKELRHHLFHRIKNDLYINLTITLKDALLGFTATINHLDNHPFVVSSTKPVAHGQILKIPGEGMIIKDSNNRGDLYVTIDVTFPESVDSKYSADIQKIFASQVFKPAAYNSL